VLVIPLTVDCSLCVLGVLGRVEREKTFSPDNVYGAKPIKTADQAISAEA
jgi:hypothetical protein